MLRGTYLKRLALVAAITFAGVTGSAQPAQAGPLCDWLFGRRPAPVAPYAVGYPYQAAYPYSAGYPVAPAATPYASAYPGTIVAPTPTYPYVIPTAPISGAAALQMPGYSAGYGAIPATGPGDQGYAMFSPPPGTQFQVDPAPATSYYGTGNVYPTYGTATPYQAAYGSGSVPMGVAPVTAYQPAIVTNPSTVQTYPGIPASSPGLFGGMSRFFSNLFGTGYQSSYYRVPVTYYRPVTSYSPAVSGTTVVQQPCTSYEYQMQRSPMTTFSPGTAMVPGAAPVTVPPANNCAPTTNYYNPYAGSTIAPAAAYDPTPTSEFPSTSQPGQYYGPPASSQSSPGSYNSGGSYNGGLTNPDNINIGQPQLESSARPTVSPYTSPPANTWWSQSAMRNSITESRAVEEKRQLSAPALQPESATSLRTDLRPIPADAFPYQQRHEKQTTTPLPPAGPTTRPSQPLESAPRNQDRAADNQDRVAAIQSWGFKPIQWTVRQAAYETPAVADQQPDPPVFDSRVIQSQVTESQLRGPALSAPQNSSGNSDAAVFGMGRSSTDTLRSTNGDVKPSLRRSYPEYDRSGWTSKPRR